jgi:replicative DNA helicase
LFTAIGNPSKKIPETPVLLWSGEMKKKQVYRRFFEMLGVPKRAMSTGKMQERDHRTGEMIDHWEKFEEAKAIVMNSPIYVADTMLDLSNLRPMIEREIDAHGIKQAVFDYDWLINAPGQGEIEQSQNISRAMKQLAHDYNISVILISSVNKSGMDSVSENVTKSNVSGSGKKLHDADIIYIITKFNAKANNDNSIMPADYDRCVTLHISKARELDYHVPGGAINYMRMTPNPRFRELKNVETKPSWMK